MAFSTYKDVRLAGGRFVSLFTLQEKPFSRACALDTSKILVGYQGPPVPVSRWMICFRTLNFSRVLFLHSSSMTILPSFGNPMALDFWGGEPAAEVGHRTGSANR